jgi:HSP20 family protein
MTVYRWEPRRDFEIAGKRLRSFFNDVEDAVAAGMKNGVHIELGTFSPRVDISESKDAVYLRAELPGMKADDVKITLAEGMITLRGAKKRPGAESTEATSGFETFHRIERSHGEFMRQFTLPDNLNEDSVEANFADGVLEVRIAKKDPEKPREREVKIVAK